MCPGAWCEAFEQQQVCCASIRPCGCSLSPDGLCFPAEFVCLRSVVLGSCGPPLPRSAAGWGWLSSWCFCWFGAVWSQL